MRIFFTNVGRYGLVRNFIPVATVLMVMMLAHSAQAFHCDNSIVSKGSFTYEVLAACGEPVQRLSRTVEVTRLVSLSTASRNGLPDRYTLVGGKVAIVEEQLVEEWIYDRGSRKLVRKLTIENGKVTKIESMGYGSLK